MPLKGPGDVWTYKMPTPESQGKKVIDVAGVDATSLIVMLHNTDVAVQEQVLMHLNEVDADVLKLKHDEFLIQKLLEILIASESNPCGQKLCLKLLTTLIYSDSAKRILCGNVCHIQHFIEILEVAKDPIVLELSLYITSVLTRRKENCPKKSYICRVLNFVKNNLDTSDLDVQYHCVSIIENLLLHDLVHSDHDIPVSKIFDIFRHGKIERLQSACLNVLYKLAILQENSYGKDVLTLIGSFASALDLLESWPHENQKFVFLHLIAALPLEYIDKEAVKKLVQILEQAGSDLMIGCISVLVSLCSNNHCEYFVDTMDIPQILLKHLTNESIEVAHIASQGVRILCTIRPDFLPQVSTDGVLSHLLKVMSNTNDPVLKTGFGELLLLMAKNDECCKIIAGFEDEGSASNITQRKASNSSKLNTLFDIAFHSSDKEFTGVIMQCVFQLMFTLSHNQCIGQEQLDIVMRYFDRSSLKDDLKTETVLQILSQCLSDPIFVDLFIKLETLPTIDNFMKQNNAPNLLLSYGRLLMNAANTDLAKVISSLNVFQWMNTHHLYEELLWHQTIQCLLDVNLTQKFAFTNSLDFFDVITDVFLAFSSRKQVNLSHILDPDKIEEVNTVVYIFTRNKDGPYMDDFIEKYISDINVFLQSTSQNIFDSVKSKSMISNEDFDVKRIKQNCKPDLEMIATYVVNQMIGDGETVDELKRDKHLEELVIQQNSHVIPIGHVKLGLQFERALLFKVLCDVFAYPCSLVRSEYEDVCYNQVLIPDSFDISREDNSAGANVGVFNVHLMCIPPLLIKARKSYCDMR